MEITEFQRTNFAKIVLILEITISNAEKFVKKFFIFGNSIEFTIQK